MSSLKTEIRRMEAELIAGNDIKQEADVIDDKEKKQEKKTRFSLIHNRRVSTKNSRIGGREKTF